MANGHESEKAQVVRASNEGEASQLAALYKYHRGPLPDPEIVEHYERIFPGAAEIVFSEWQKETAARRENDRIALESDVEDRRAGRRIEAKGQSFGLAVAAFWLGVCGVLIYNGHEVSGTILGAGGLGSMVSAFIYGRSKHIYLEANSSDTETLDQAGQRDATKQLEDTNPSYSD